MADYEPAFKTKLGVKKVKHLKLVGKKDLSDIGMLPIERKRCLQKLAKEIGSMSKTDQTDKALRHTVHMPSTCFGHAVVDISETDLIKDYSNLYYVSPQNFKQIKTNELILQMCASSKWRFSSKTVQEVWAREERRMRCVSLNVFADPSEVKEVTRYYKDQCLLYQLGFLQGEYADIEKLSKQKKEGISEQVLKNKQERLAHYKASLENLVADGKNAFEGVKRCLDGVVGKIGRKEEEVFWSSQ